MCCFDRLDLWTLGRMVDQQKHTFFFKLVMTVMPRVEWGWQGR